MYTHACNEYAWSKKRGVFENFSGSAGTPRTDATQLLQSMGAITGEWVWGSGPPQKLDGPLNFLHSYWCRSGGGNRLPQTGYTFLFFLEKGSNTPDREVGPPNFENAVAPLPKSDLIIIIIIIKRRLISRRNMPGTLQGRVRQINTRKRQNMQ